MLNQREINGPVHIGPRQPPKQQNIQRGVWFGLNAQKLFIDPALALVLNTVQPSHKAFDPFLAAFGHIGPNLRCGTAKIEQANQVVHVDKATPTHFRQAALSQALQELQLWTALKLCDCPQCESTIAVRTRKNVGHKKFVESNECVRRERQA